MAVMAQLKGGKQLAQSLREFPKKIRNKYARAALRKGATVIKKQAKANVNSITGKTVRSIKVRVKVRGATLTAMIGPKPLKVMGKGKDAFYMDWEDVGHFTGQGGRHGVRLSRGESRSADRDFIFQSRSIAKGRKWVGGTFFMERALASKGGEAATVVTDDLKKSIEATKLN